METVFKWRARTGGGVSLIHLLVRCFAVSAAILLLADGRHADAVDPAAPVEIQQTGSSSEVADEQQWRMVRTRGNQFVVGDDDDHRPFYVNGFNTYWLMILAVDPSTRGKVTEVFQQAAAAGLTVCRTWAFNDGGWRALQKSPSVYDQDVFKALDFVVSEARKYRIRLILSLINNWDSYGGKAQYVKWAGDDAAADGGRLNITASVDDDFFSDQTVKVYFKNHVKNMLTRVNTYTSVMYKDDPTIFAWELMNEPRCTSDPAGNKLQEWIQEMAFHVKSIDPDHLLEVGGLAQRASTGPRRRHGFRPTRTPMLARSAPTSSATTASWASTSPPSTSTQTPGCRARLWRHGSGSWTRGWRRTSPTPTARWACRWCSRSSGRPPPRPGAAASTRPRETSSSRRCTRGSSTPRGVAAPERGLCSGRCSRWGPTTWTMATASCFPGRRPLPGSSRRTPGTWPFSTRGAPGAAAGGAGGGGTSRRILMLMMTCRSSRINNEKHRINTTNER
uniref:mannan endo-1,4-beta-mannosidase n=1 Tax=Zea mays TaxID=4577 RepID=A0A804PQP0_MAIZE